MWSESFVYFFTTSDGIRRFVQADITKEMLCELYNDFLNISIENNNFEQYYISDSKILRLYLDNLHITSNELTNEKENESKIKLIIENINESCKTIIQKPNDDSVRYLDDTFFPNVKHSNTKISLYAVDTCRSIQKYIFPKYFYSDDILKSIFPNVQITRYEIVNIPLAKNAFEQLSPLYKDKNVLVSKINDLFLPKSDELETCGIEDEDDEFTFNNNIYSEMIPEFKEKEEDEEDLKHLDLTASRDKIILAFIRKICVPAVGKRIKSSELYSYFTRFCQENNYDKRFNITMFTTRLLELSDYTQKRYSDAIYWTNISLVDELNK